MDVGRQTNPQQDGGYELKDIHLMKPSFIVEEDSENHMSKLSTDATDSNSSEDDSHIKEQQEHFLGIYKRFKEEVDRHLQDYDKINEDLEEHQIEIKRTAERQRAAQKKLLSQLEQAIKVQLDEAESRITTVQELARKKMLQLKLLVAECIKHGAFG
ncbi:UNVERIFIED_CONTAM: Meiosis-specific protein ASY3 [Sesamum radiatum]|uniref:Meiosis-specific protein ASY3 n=1 Tax=Sesamum radiatum TaxID=300843 RepID=A0AAW2W255_SESRA